jgi:hypothetical protein
VGITEHKDQIKAAGQVEGVPWTDRTAAAPQNARFRSAKQRQNQKIRPHRRMIRPSTFYSPVAFSRRPAKTNTCCLDFKLSGYMHKMPSASAPVEIGRAESDSPKSATDA